MNQSEWLKKIFKHRPQGYDPYIEKHFDTDNGLKYGSWDKYQGQKRIDERSVFPNEIIIDIDTDTTEKAKKENRKVTTYLDNNSFDYFIADTGGTGYHIHLFFKYESLNADQYRPYRIALYEYLKQECKEKADAETQLWDDQPVRFDISDSKGHLVRALGGRKTSSRNRKTQVLKSSLDKKEIQELEEVEYPERIPWGIEISKTGTDKSDLSISEINDKVQEVKEEEKQMHDKEVEADYDTKVEGIEDVRNIPASKVLDLLGKDYKKRSNFECPFHADSNPSANLHKKDGVERLYCFSDSCADEGRVKVWNAVDMMMEEGYDFTESLEKLGDRFDIDVQIGYNPGDYFGYNQKGNLDFLPQKIVDELLDEYRFKAVEKRGLYVWKDGHWQKVTKDQGLISREVNKRLKNETQSNYRNNVKDILRDREEIQTKRKNFESPNKMIPFDNGVYDIEKEELKEHKPGYNFTFKYDAKYNPNSEGEGVTKLINDVAPESKEKRKKLKEILAVAIAPWKVNQKVPIFHGQGANGKNQIVKVLFKIVGKSNYHKTDAHSLQNDKFETASLIDKQVAFFDEFEDASKPGKLKGIVGDSEQKVREMQKESYTAKTSVYGIFAANELPNPNDNSDGFYRRWEIVDFNQKFTDVEDDGNPDKVDPWKLEEKYMKQDDIDAFATELVSHLKDVLDRGKILNQRTTEQVRRIWNRKSGNAVYAFIDKYLAQGKKPYQNSDESSEDLNNNFDADWIAKDDMIDIVNEYLDYHNNSSIRKDQLTRAFKRHPDLDVECNYRPTTNEGERVTAYGGVKLDPNHVRDVNAFSMVSRVRTRGSLTKVNQTFWVDILDNPSVQQVVRYLLGSDNEGEPLFEVVRNTDISHGDMTTIKQSDVIEIENSEEQEIRFPVFKLNKQKVDEYKEKAENVGQKTQVIVDKIKEMDAGEGVPIEEIIESVELDEESTEKTIESLKNEGQAFEPKPGKVKLV